MATREFHIFRLADRTRIVNRFHPAREMLESENIFLRSTFLNCLEMGTFSEM